LSHKTDSKVTPEGSIVKLANMPESSDALLSGLEYDDSWVLSCACINNVLRLVHTEDYFVALLIYNTVDIVKPP